MPLQSTSDGGSVLIHTTFYIKAIGNLTGAIKKLIANSEHAKKLIVFMSSDSKSKTIMGQMILLDTHLYSQIDISAYFP